jgi:hypothetical protein
MKGNSKQAFHGFFSPGLIFADGHAMRIYNFTSTPAIAWDWLDSGALQIHLDASDGQTLDMDVRIDSSWATTLLNASVKIAPRELMRTRPMLAVSGLSFNLLLGLGGVEIAGKTHTGRACVTEADRVAIITGASARLSSQDLGELTRPHKELIFSKSRITNRPIFAFGTANIENPNA